jgi:phosphatidylinositol-3-phosphatase
MSACPSCAAPLPPGQRYCLACGERHAALPAHVAAWLGVATQAEPPPVPAPEAPRRSSSTLNAPAAAVAVMAILGFGVIVGSVVSPPAQSAPAAVIALQQPPPTPAPVTPPAAPATTAAPAPTAPAPVQQTVTQTIAAPPPPPPAPTPVVPTGPQLPDVKHLFLIVLPPAGYDTTFGPSSQTPYLATELTKQGELISNYYAVTDSELANKIALVSGQGPNPDTSAGCTSYNEITPGGESTDPQQKGQVLGTGCVFPRATLTLADELVANGSTWKAYVQDPPPAPDAPPPDPNAPPGPCGRAPDTPFASFHSVTDLPDCAQSFAGMDQLTTDLSTATATPTLAYIEPHLADLSATDAFLKDLIPRITASPAYKDGGMIAITFANAPQDGPDADASACCAEPVYPNMPPAQPAPPADPSVPPKPLPPGADVATGGGGRVGLLLISPFVKAGTSAVSSYNHYSLLRSIEDLFQLQPTGYAGYPGVLAFDSVIYNGAATSS